MTTLASESTESPTQTVRLVSSDAPWHNHISMSYSNAVKKDYVVFMTIDRDNNLGNSAKISYIL